MHETIGIGIVGYGAFGEISTEQYATLPDARIVAVIDTDPQRQQLAVERFQTQAHRDLEQLIADPAVDVVVLNTPPWLHGSQAIQAAKAGKHLFVEKPLATHLDQAREVLEIAQEKHLHVSIDYVMRHVSLYATLRRLLAGPFFGDVTYMMLENHASNEALHANHWMWDRAKSGGIFVEHGVHFFDLCNTFTASLPQHVVGFAQTSAGDRQDRVLASVQYRNGSMATFVHSFDRRATLERTTLEITCERARVKVYGWIPERIEIEGMIAREHYDLLVATAGVPVTISKELAGPPAEAVVHLTITQPNRTAEYAAAIRAGMHDLLSAIRDPHFQLQVTAADGFASLALALAAQQSIETGTTQEVISHA